MNRPHAAIEPQLSLPAAAACVSYVPLSMPAHREAPPSA